MRLDRRIVPERVEPSIVNPFRNGFSDRRSESLQEDVMPKMLTIAAMWVVLSGHDALCQEVPTVHVGSRVRLRAMKGTFVGQVKKIEPRILTLLEDTKVESIEIPTPSITRVELSTNRRRHAKQGALIGTGIGLVLGLLAGTGDGVCYALCDPSETIPAGAASGLLWGSLIGVLIVTEDWTDGRVEDVRPAKPVRISIAPVRRGAGLAVSIAF
jgi:hypothetical protein